MDVCNMKRISCVLVRTSINKFDIYSYCQTKLGDSSVHFTCSQLSFLAIPLQLIHFNYRSPKAFVFAVFPCHL